MPPAPFFCHENLTVGVCMWKRHVYVVLHAGKDVGASSGGDVRGTRTQGSRQVAKFLPTRVQGYGDLKALPPAGMAWNVRAVPPRGP